MEKIADCLPVKFVSTILVSALVSLLLMLIDYWTCGSVPQGFTEQNARACTHRNAGRAGRTAVRVPASRPPRVIKNGVVLFGTFVTLSVRQKANADCRRGIRPDS